MLHNEANFQSTQDVISELRASKEKYSDAAEREGEFWGKMFSDERILDVRKRDAEASILLHVDKGRRLFSAIAQENGWTFTRGLSLACGSGRAERPMVESRICKSFVGIDIAADALDEARKIAAEQGLDIEYRTGDLNDVRLSPGEFDLVITQNCLHHILELEHLAEEIWTCLKPGGLLWIDDFIGETQFQWLDKRLIFVNELLAAIPERYRVSALTGLMVGPYERAAPGNIGSPFEAIRSGEIMPVFTRWFEPIYTYESSSLLHLISPLGTHEAYATSENGRELYGVLQAMDHLLIATGTLPPLAGQYVLKRRDDVTRGY